MRPARSRTAGASGSAAAAGLAVGALFRDGRYWLLLGGMFAGTFAGLLTIGNLKPIGLAGGSPGAKWPSSLAAKRGSDV